MYGEIGPIMNTNDNVAIFRRVDSEIAADLNRYTTRQALITRTLSIVSSSISIVSGVIAIYFFLCIDHRRRVFRHQLTFCLILYDFLKAVLLLMYPVRVIAKSSSYYDLPFCRVVGFFTAFSIERGDIVILSFAIHIALLIYLPQQSVKRGEHYDGGLYKYRYFLYVISIILPALLASLAFIRSEGYAPLTNWCYIPSRPIWYRLVLSWGPRYFIIVVIFIIYCCIYTHVRRLYKRINDKEKSSQLNTYWSYWTRLLSSLKFLKLSDSKNKDNNANDNRDMGESDQFASCKARPLTFDLSSEIELNVAENLNKEVKKERESRQTEVERQIRTIFIYPVSYVISWIATLIVHAMDFQYGLTREPVFWLNGIAAFMQPFNCTVDTVVFMIREKPWTLRMSAPPNSSVFFRAFPFLCLFSRRQNPTSNKQEKFDIQEEKCNERGIECVRDTNSHSLSASDQDVSEVREISFVEFMRSYQP